MDSGNPGERTNRPPTPEQVKHFWAFTRDHVGWTTLEGIFGQQQVSSIEPPWMHLAESPADADALLEQLVTAGQLTIETEIYEGEPQPRRGDLVIISNAEGRPTALAATLKVEDDPQKVRIVKETLRCLYPQPGGHPGKASRDRAGRKGKGKA